MSTIELTASQETILSALTNMYSEQEDAVKGEAIANTVGRTPGTIRNQMQSLKALQLVEGVPGPKGGYKPTANAYETLDVQRMEEPAEVDLRHNGEKVESVNIEGIDLSSVHHPELCRAEIHVQGSVRDFHEGDSVTVGPTPLSKLLVEATVDGKEETANVLILRIDDMRAPVEEPNH
ncbi:TrmB family transcriptional regulator [Haloparvum sp. AD34]